METSKRPKSSHCSGINCNNSRQFTPELSFFRFPKDVERCMRWVINCRRQDLLDKMKTDPITTTQQLYKSNVLCAEHFEEKQFMNAIQRKSLIPLAVPTLFKICNPPPPETSKRKSPLKRKLEVHDSAMKKKKKMSCDSEAGPSSSLPIVHGDPDETSESDASALKIEAMRKQIAALRSKVKARDKKIATLSDKIQSMEQTNQQKFIQSLPSSAQAFIESQLQASGRSKTGRRWSIAEKKLAITLYHSSPKTYKILRQ
ncbi:52 kd repressor of inhibitor of protein kinase [Plakobranchus ocellatus]|uniref:52 kd repressor of inhibitor of protein kinase n=1 Tax=Plakobranchus ocellatus TaxID=259542 RepID=A0AAV4ARE6_9GAST|nr:52 kd repressor of inhibitor of protein kinase [Plakobranchus ocellatus]